MCWKQEWAHSINNLQHAIEHIQKAQDKINKRVERNKNTLKKKSNDKYETEKIRERLFKNREAFIACKTMIIALRDEQERLFDMIHKYGISKSENPQRVYKLMGKFPYEEYLSSRNLEKVWHIDQRLSDK